MKRIGALVAILAGMALPSLAAQKVSVDQLEGILAQSRTLTDAEAAAKLTDLQLSECFSATRLARWKASLPGPRSQRALIGLADRSAFLEPPAADIPTTAMPDVPEQRRIMGLVATYVGQAIPQLPRFYASRTIVHFEGTLGTMQDVLPDDGTALHAVRITRATVMNRDGQEIVEQGAVKAKAEPAERGLKTWGAFGPILGLVLVDAAQNKLAWAHWEKGTAGDLAVFRYSVARDRSHYEVRYCCTAAAYGFETNAFSAMSAYHGEIAVDPANGTIDRITIEAELGGDDPIERAALLVEYAPVELGGMTYVCPSRSVSLSVAKTLKHVQDPSGRSWATMGPWQMLLNHASFEQYHLYHADSRVLTHDEERAAGVAPDATLPSVQPDAEPAQEELADAPSGSAIEGSGATEIAKTAAPSANGEAQEITTAAATALPDSPNATQPSTQPGAVPPAAFTFRVSSRLVDVGAVAIDKKGHPITNLKAEDFEVYDNGVKQDVHSFERVGTETADESAKPQKPAEPAAVLASYSNQGLRNSSADANGNTIILLVDAGNLSFADFADARQQMVQFLRALPANERVALYTMRYHTYQVLVDATTNHDAVLAKLSKWMPTAQDMANANDEEQRNRQMIETVHSPEDMLSVNGNETLDAGAQTEGLDPKLRELGSRPGPIALALLRNVAHHLGAMPGHKSLIWVTSDNVLADWNKASVSIEKSSKYIEPEALRTQEAMNNAHVSVYPIDGSRLEANMISPELGRRNVELTPTFQRPLGYEERIEGPEATATTDMNPYIQNRNFGSGGRLMAQLEQDLHPIQGVFREVAEATGGHAQGRTNNMIGALNGVVADAHATYMLGFAPSQPADGQYHVLTVKLVNHKDATVRYRTGYLYEKEPTTLKERFTQAVTRPTDTSEISVSTKPITDAAGKALRVTVSGADLALAEQSSVHTGKLDIFLVHQDGAEEKAKVTGLTVALRLKPETYQRAMNEGLTFDERIDGNPSGGPYRVVVVDVNSGRIGSVTVPLTALQVENVTN